MMQGLLQRRSSSLSHIEWLVEPFLDEPKTVEQQVYDYGLILSGVFERVDALPENNLDTDLCMDIVRDCTEVQSGTERIITESLCLAHPDGGTNSSASSGSESHVKQIGDTPGETPALLLTLTAMGVQLGACASGCTAYFRLIAQAHLQDIGEESSLATIMQMVKPLLHNRQVLAKTIFRLVTHYVRSNADVNSTARTVFPLRQAIKHLSQEDEEYAESATLMQRLTTKNWQFGPLLSPWS